MVRARASAGSVQFLRDIAESDADERCRAAALDALTTLSSESGDEPDPADSEFRLNSTAEKVLRAFLVDREFPADLSSLAELSAGNAEYLLAELLDAVLRHAHDGASIADLRVATARLRMVHAALSQDGIRVARLIDPRLLTVPVRLRPWVGSLLTLVHPDDVLAATERLLIRPGMRLSALRWLRQSASRIGTAELADPPAGESDQLYLLMTNAFPVTPVRGTAHDRVDSGAVPAPDAPTRTAYPLLDAPDRVAAEAVFELRVGLAPSPGAGVASSGSFDVSTEPFSLTVVLNVDGFTVLGGATTSTIEVTPQDPYPYAVVRLRADNRPDLKPNRVILAVYSVDGRQLGIASRAVLVGAEPAEQPVRSAAGVDWVLPADAPRPDLEVVLARGNDDLSMHWHFRSPHPKVGESAGFLTAKPGPDVAATAKRFLAAIESRAAYGDLAERVNFVASRLGRLVHPEVWHALEKAAMVARGRPSVLLATADPYLPWELALVPKPWAPGSPRLGAQAVVGRWPYTTPASTPAPPATLDATSMAVVTGQYRDKIRLPQAEAEGETLVGRYRAATVTPSIADVRDLLRGLPKPVDILHVALHGNFDATGTRNGIVMIDETYLSPETIEGIGRGPVRFAFLNACQAAQGVEVLGEYAGLADALLRIGAVGVVAPLWKVDDDVARTVAEAYYPAVLEKGSSPAEFLRDQRAADRDVRTTKESSRLAYVYFGHPLLRVRWNGMSDHA